MTARMRGLSTLVLAPQHNVSWLARTEHIDNYPGLPGTSGQKLLDTFQAQALAMRRIYDLPAAQQPARLRLLMLMVAGDLSANTPLDCLLEDSDIDLIFYYVTPGDPLTLPIGMLLDQQVP